MIEQRAAGWRALVDDLRAMHPLDRRDLTARVAQLVIGGAALVALVAAAAVILA